MAICFVWFRHEPIKIYEMMEDSPMTTSSKKIDIYLEVGKKRTFAGAIDWPGWCRVGRDEESALQALLDAAPRYARIVRLARLDFKAPRDVSTFRIIERLKGSATTDFGAPDIAPTTDKRPLKDKELQHLQSILKAGWRALNSAATVAKGKKLRAGPRGGGRTLKGILEHVHGSEIGYLSALGGRVSSTASPEEIHQAILDTLQASAHGEIAKKGPRGGKRWLPYYFVRREAWHVLDHIWEIEDRSS
jgi:hypothetical protein